MRGGEILEEEGDPEDRAEECHDEEDGPAKVAQDADIQEAVAVGDLYPVGQ